MFWKKIIVPLIIFLFLSENIYCFDDTKPPMFMRHLIFSYGGALTVGMMGGGYISLHLFVPEHDRKPNEYKIFKLYPIVAGIPFTLGSALAVSLISQQKHKIFFSTAIFNASVIGLLYANKRYIEATFYTQFAPAVTSIISYVLERKNYKAQENHTKIPIPTLYFSKKQVFVGLTMNF